MKKWGIFGILLGLVFVLEFFIPHRAEAETASIGERQEFFDDSVEAQKACLLFSASTIDFYGIYSNSQCHVSVGSLFDSFIDGGCEAASETTAIFIPGEGTIPCQSYSFITFSWPRLSCSLGEKINRETGVCEVPGKNKGKAKKKKNPDKKCISGGFDGGGPGSGPGSGGPSRGYNMMASGSVGNPIQTSTGNKWQEEEDLGGPLNFVRSYNSSNGNPSLSVGAHWTHSYARSLAFATLNRWARVYRPDGKIYLFNKIDDFWSSDADILDQLTELKDEAGNTTGWSYRVDEDRSTENYSPQGVLLSITDRHGFTQTLTYSDGSTPQDIAPAIGLLLQVTDSYGRSLHLTYDENHRIHRLIDPAGGIFLYTYDASDNLTQVTYPDGSTRTYHYNEPAFTQETDLPHALTGITDENGVHYSNYLYDSNGRAVEEVYPAAEGNVNHYQISTDSNHQISTVIDPLGTTRTYHFMSILGTLQPLGQDQPGGSGCDASSFVLHYDEQGNVTDEIDFNHHHTDYQYDLSRNLEILRKEGLTEEGHITAETRIIETSWDPRWEMPTQILEKDSTETLLRQTDSVYDDHSNLVRQTLIDPIQQKHHTTESHYTYDEALPGHVEQLKIDGPRTDLADVTTLDYWPADANCASSVTSNNMGYEAGCRGQIRQITNAQGQVTHYNRYNPYGQIEEIVDPNGQITESAYDSRKRLIEKKIRDGSTTEVTQYRYDGLGQLIELIQPDGSSLSYTYDGAHRLVEIQDNLSNRIHHTLDAMGNRIHETITDPNGLLTSQITQSIDALNRIQQVRGE